MLRTDWDVPRTEAAELACAGREDAAKDELEEALRALETAALWALTTPLGATAARAEALISLLEGASRSTCLMERALPWMATFPLAAEPSETREAPLGPAESLPPALFMP